VGLDGEKRLRRDPAARSRSAAQAEEAGWKALWGREGAKPLGPSTPRPRRCAASAMKARQGRDGAYQRARGTARQRGPARETPQWSVRSPYSLTSGTRRTLALASGLGMLGRPWASVKTGAHRLSGQHVSPLIIYRSGRAALELWLHHAISVVRLGRIEIVPSDRVRCQVGKLKPRRVRSSSTQGNLATAALTAYLLGVVRGR